MKELPRLLAVREGVTSSGGPKMDCSPASRFPHVHPIAPDLRKGRQGERDVALIGRGLGGVEQKPGGARGEQGVELEGQLPAREIAGGMSEGKRRFAILDANAESQRLFRAEQSVELSNHPGQCLGFFFANHFQERRQFL